MINRYCIFLISFLITISCNHKENKKKSKKNNINTSINEIKNLKNDDRKVKVESFFLKKFKKNQFNGNILFAENGNIISKESYGYANISKKEELTEKHTFQLASVSKPFTAIAVLQLIEDGKLSLNDTINQFFSDFPYDGITIHQLLSHRSGLSQYTHFCDNPSEVWPD